MMPSAFLLPSLYASLHFRLLWVCVCQNEEEETDLVWQELYYECMIYLFSGFNGIWFLFFISKEKLVPFPAQVC